MGEKKNLKRDKNYAIERKFSRAKQFCQIEKCERQMAANSLDFNNYHP